jgi:hypothetical protein
MTRKGAEGGLQKARTVGSFLDFTSDLEKSGGNDQRDIE